MHSLSLVGESKQIREPFREGNMPKKKKTEQESYPAGTIFWGDFDDGREIVEVEHSRDEHGNFSFNIKIEHPWAGKMECTYKPDPALLIELWNYFARLHRYKTEDGTTESNGNLAAYYFFDARQILIKRVGPKLNEALKELIAEIKNRTLIAHEFIPVTKQIESFAEAIKTRVKENMGMRAGRPKHSGYFWNGDDFLKALEDVFSTFDKEPSQPQVLSKLSQHKLWQGKKSFTLEEAKTRTKTLRDWLGECGLTWPQALENHYHPEKRGIIPDELIPAENNPPIIIPLQTD